MLKVEAPNPKFDSPNSERIKKCFFGINELLRSGKVLVRGVNELLRSGKELLRGINELYRSRIELLNSEL
jgi:hypothetical protein